MTTRRNGFITHYFQNTFRELNCENPDFYILSIYNGSNSQV